MRASGHLESYSQELVGEGDQRKAIVRSKRGGVEIVNEFSVADAKRAQLWAKAGPWSQYPDRMLIFRARGFNLRDNFGDVLKGFRTTEELADIPEEREVAGRVVAPNFDDEAELGPVRKRRSQQPAAPPLDVIPPDKALAKLAEIKKVVAPAADYPEPDPAAEVMLRLKEEQIPQDDFLNLLAQLDLITTDSAAIEMGHFTIGHVSQETLQMALKDWPNVIKQLRAVTS